VQRETEIRERLTDTESAVAGSEQVVSGENDSTVIFTALLVFGTDNTTLVKSRFAAESA